MMRNGNRTIKVKKEELIKKIKENKENHIKMYAIAVKAYKLEALEQLEKLTDEVNDGSLNIQLDLVTPVNNEKNYDDILQMFEWEIDEEVELSQNEFREYVQDETSFAVHALSSNTLYSQKFGDLS